MRIRGMILTCICSLGAVSIAGAVVLAMGQWENWRAATTADGLLHVFAQLSYANERYSVERGDFTQMLLSDAQTSGPVYEKAKQSIALTDESLAAAKASAATLDASDRTVVEAPLAKITATIRQLRETALSQVARPRGDRDASFISGFVPTSVEQALALTRLGTQMELRITETEASIGRLAGLARLCSAFRDAAGRRATMLTTYLATGKAFTPTEVAQYYTLDGQVEAYWAVTAQASKDLSTVPGITAALAQAQTKYMNDLGALSRKIVAAARGETPPPVSLVDWRAQNGPALRDALAPRDAAVAAANVTAQDLMTSARNGFLLACAGILAILLVVAGFAMFITRRLVTPIRGLSHGIEQIANGVLDVHIPGAGRTDEVGEISRSVEVLRANSLEMVRLQAEQVTLRTQAEEDRRAAFKEVADELDRVVGRIAGAVSSTSEELQASARGMSAMAEQTSNRSGQASQASQLANDMVGSVAAAAEELSASVVEIGARVNESARIARLAVTEANDAASKVTTMSEAAGRIGDILRLISDIAGQTNLLALNATIEAARAGEAGRGFAVVASEVKNLAEQTSKATAEIEAQISTVQRATDDAVSAITGIASTIGHINEISGSIASAVTQQQAATSEIAGSIARASDGAREASENMLQVNQTAAETGSAASEVLGASTELSRTSGELRVATDSFVARIRSA